MPVAPSPASQERGRARYPECLVRHALVSYREPGAEQEQRATLEPHHISVLTRSTWERHLWNYFPQIISPEHFYAYARLIQLRAGIENPVHPLDFEERIIHECISGKFRRDYLSRQRIVSEVAEHWDELEYDIMRQILKGKRHETREEGRRRLWDFCSEPDEEIALRILFRPDQIEALITRFERKPLIETVRPLRYRTEDGERLSTEARVLVQELRFSFLSNRTGKGNQCFKGHPTVMAAAAEAAVEAAQETAETDASNEGEPATEGDHAEAERAA